MAGFDYFNRQEKEILSRLKDLEYNINGLLLLTHQYKDSQKSKDKALRVQTALNELQKQKQALTDFSCKLKATISYPDN